jgi:hypothetical protein
MKTSNRLLLIIIVIVIILMAFVATDFYFANLWYGKPQYTLGCRNGSNVVVDNVTLNLKPEGEFSCGILSPSPKYGKTYMDPPWPIPKAITLTFTNEAETKSYKVEKPTNIPSNLHGDITVVILKKNGKFTFDIDLKKEKQ